MERPRDCSGRQIGGLTGLPGASVTGKHVVRPPLSACRAGEYETAPQGKLAVRFLGGVRVTA